MRLLNLRINSYLLRTFCPHLGSFLCCFFFHYVSAKFHLWPSSGDLPQPRIGMLSLVTVSPVITAFHSCCLSHHVFYQVNLWPEGRGSVRDDERCGRSKDVNTPELIGQRVRVRVTMLRFEGSSGRDSVGRGQHSSNRVCGISTRTMHQSTTPSLSQTIWPRWASRQFLTLTIVQTLLPVIFGYSLSSGAVVMR